MPDLDGIALATLLRQRAPSVDIILMTAFDDVPTFVAAMREDPVAFLVKPIDVQKLRPVLIAITLARCAGEGAIPGFDSSVSTTFSLKRSAR
jgi:DNA-binding NtrC family response regulator